MVKKHTKHHLIDYDKIMNSLIFLIDPIEKFFDNVQIHHHDATLKKNRLKLVDSKLEQYFFKKLLKIGYVFNNSKNLSKKKFFNLIVKAFQRRYRQQVINGKVDKECILISENLAKKLN